MLKKACLLLVFMYLPALAGAADLSDAEVGQIQTIVKNSCQNNATSMRAFLSEANIELVCQCTVDRLTDSIRQMPDTDAEQLRRADPDVMARWVKREIGTMASCVAPKLSDALEGMVLASCHANPAQVTGSADGKRADGSDGCACIASELKSRYPTETLLRTLAEAEVDQGSSSTAKDTAGKLLLDTLRQAQSACAQPVSH